MRHHTPRSVCATALALSTSLAAQSFTITDFSTVAGSVSTVGNARNTIMNAAGM